MRSKQRGDQRNTHSDAICPSCGGDAPALHVGAYRLFVATRTLGAHGSEISLAPRTLRILLALVAARGDVVSRDALIDRGWPDVVVSDESLTQAISELRKAFRHLGCQSKAIETVSRSGYRLVLAMTCDGCDTAHGDRVIPAPGVDLEALGLCLEAKRTVTRSGEAGMKAATLLTAEAVRIAPGYAQAHAFRAVMLATLQLYRDDGGRDLRDAIKHAESAMRIDSRSAYAWAALGYSLGALGHYDRAQNAYTQAIDLDPYNADTYHMAARTLFSARRYAIAATLAQRAADLDTTCFYSLSLASRAAAVFDPARSRMYARQAVLRARETLRYDPEQPRARGVLGLSLAGLGCLDEAAELATVDRDKSTSSQFPNVVTLCLLGYENEAMEALSSAVDSGWRHADWLYAEPAFAILHKRREFRSLASSIEAA